MNTCYARGVGIIPYAYSSTKDICHLSWYHTKYCQTAVCRNLTTALLLAAPVSPPPTPPRPVVPPRTTTFSASIMALRQVGAAQMRTALRLARTHRQQTQPGGCAAVHNAFAPTFCANSSSSSSKRISGSAGRRSASTSSGSEVTSSGKRPLSSNASANPEVVSASVTDITSKFGDPSFWEGEYSTQVRSCYSYCTSYKLKCWKSRQAKCDTTINLLMMR